MNWSPMQCEALDAVARWMNSSEQVFRLFGYAGTGKTTLAKHFAESTTGTVMFAAYTGKAAYVLRRRGCPSATTIHSLIYHPSESSGLRLKDMKEELKQVEAQLPDPELEEQAEWLRAEIKREQANLRRPRFTLNMDSDLNHASLLVIDECSMVDKAMGNDLLSFGKKILVLGDPAQLPPVGGEGFFTKHKPDFLLTEIHRQAAGNPIIDMATKVRQGERLQQGEYGSSIIMRKTDLTPDIATSADQIIVGRNATRRSANRRSRQILGFTDPLPEAGDRIVCLRNDHDIGLLNGAIWEVQASARADDFVNMTIQDVESDVTLDVVAHTAHFLGEELDWWDRRAAQEFDYGYALTCHKSQGSQWDDVLVINESGCFRKDARRWLYTAITRASDRITIAQ